MLYNLITPSPADRGSVSVLRIIGLVEKITNGTIVHRARKYDTYSENEVPNVWLK